MPPPRAPPIPQRAAMSRPPQLPGSRRNRLRSRVAGFSAKAPALPRPLRKAAAAMAAAVLVHALLLGIASADDSMPQLRLLGLRCADRPLDLRPAFSPAHYIYSTRLDFADGSFSVDAIPDEGAEVSDSADLKVAKMIPPGSKHKVVIQVKDTSTTSSMDYTISVERLDGTETGLRSIELPGTTISPMFVPDKTEYTVKTPAHMDRLDLRFVPWDSGQSFEVLALEAESDFEAVEQWTTTSKPVFVATPAPAFDVMDQGGAAATATTVPPEQGTADAKESAGAATTTTLLTTMVTTMAAGTCFDSGKFYGPEPNMAGQSKSSEASALDCQARCHSTAGCAHFTFWPDGGCHLQGASASAADAPPDVVTGPPECQAPCFAKNVYYGPRPNMPYEGKTTEQDAKACQKRCAKTPDCAHFTFWPDGGCHLQDASASQVATAHETLAGPRKCGGSGGRLRLRRLLRELSASAAGGDSNASANERGREASRGLSARRLEETALGDGGGTALLPPSGESQYMMVERWFLMEVGQKRLVTIKVSAANGDPSLNRTYRLQVTREPCPPERPLYAPDVGDCAVTCNPAYFANQAARRCEACPVHCMRCIAWDQCLACEPSHWRAFHIIQLSGGRCHIVQIPWQQILGGIASAIVVLALAACCCCGTCGPSEGRASRKHGGAFLRRGRQAGGDVNGGPETDRLLSPTRGGKLSDDE